MNKVAVPKVGMRIVKTVVAVFICFLIDVFRTGGIPFYSAIAAKENPSAPLPTGIGQRRQEADEVLRAAG